MKIFVGDNVMRGNAGSRLGVGIIGTRNNWDEMISPGLGSRLGYGRTTCWEFGPVFALRIIGARVGEALAWCGLGMNR